MYWESCVTDIGPVRCVLIGPNSWYTGTIGRLGIVTGVTSSYSDAGWHEAYMCSSSTLGKSSYGDVGSSFSSLIALL